MKTPPEQCTLTATWSGDGWQLCVEDANNEVIAYLKWPERWPNTMSAEALEQCGFVIG